MPEKKKRISLIIQVAILFVAGLILIGTLSSLVSYFVSKLYVTDQLKASAKAIAMDLEGYINQFPSHDLILRCWYDNYDKLDIEYDADYNTETLTAEKCRLLAQRHPEFQLEYATVKDVEALPLEDRMLYAEIIYSWLISRIDQTAEHYNLDYLYCVITEAPYDQQFVLFIASENSVKRGNEPRMLYPFGKIIKSTKEQQDAIKKAVSEEPQLAPDKSGDYLDYYYPIASVDGHDVLIGVTRNVQFLEKKTKSYSFNLSVISIIFLSIMAIDCLLMILFVVLRPLKKIQDSIRLYKDTKDGAAVAKNLSEVKSRNELSQLKDDVADLTKEMDDYIVRIEKGVSEKERIRTEMTLASRIQTAMLPNVFPPYPDRKDFEICASMTPAKQIGGDFYDFFLLKDR